MKQLSRRAARKKNRRTLEKTSTLKNRVKKRRSLWRNYREETPVTIHEPKNAENPRGHLASAMRISRAEADALVEKVSNIKEPPAEQSKARERVAPADLDTSAPPTQKRKAHAQERAQEKSRKWNRRINLAIVVSLLLLGLIGFLIFKW